MAPGCQPRGGKSLLLLSPATLAIPGAPALDAKSGLPAAPQPFSGAYQARLCRRPAARGAED
jgi:hypothetical protein